MENLCGVLVSTLHRQTMPLFSLGGAEHICTTARKWSSYFYTFRLLDRDMWIVDYSNCIVFRFYNITCFTIYVSIIWSILLMWRQGAPILMRCVAESAATVAGAVGQLASVPGHTPWILSTYLHKRCQRGFAKFYGAQRRPLLGQKCLLVPLRIHY